MKGKNKKNSKNDIMKYVKLGLVGLGLVLVILSFIITDLSVPFKFFGVILMTFSGIMASIQSEKYSLIKSASLVALAAIVLTWLLPNGGFNGATFTESNVVGFSAMDISTTLYYSVYFALDKIVILLIIAAFYGILSKTASYEKITSTIAKKLEGNKTVVAISSIVLFVILTSLFTQVLIVLAFVPFVLTILSKMKMDKLITFTVTFGAILIGMIGSPWGTEGLAWFTSYTSIPVENGFEYRILIQLAALVLFTLFTVLRLKSTNNDSKKEEDLIVDPLEVKENKTKINTIPMIVLLSLTAVILILGYINWEQNFGITIFSEFHTWLTTLTIGEDYMIFGRILGAASMPFGTWDLLAGMVVLFIMSILVAVVGRIKFENVINDAASGIKAFATPTALLIVIFMVFIVSYISPIMASVSNWFFTLTNGIEPNLSALTALFTAVFHPDLGYTGYVVGPFITTMYADALPLIVTIFTSMFGLVQVFAPTSIILLIGLSYTKLSYKTWLKYIWMFLVGMFVILLILFNVLVYLG